MTSGGDERDLGRTGRRVSNLGLGLAALGRPGYLNLGHGKDIAGSSDPEALKAHTHELLGEAWAQGITYFDAARSYGRAEDYLASWLEKRGFSHDARRPTIGSKWGYTYVADWQIETAVHEVKNLSVEQLNRQFSESHGLLGPYLDVLQIHSATVASGVLDDDAVIGRLGELRADGVSIGLTVTGPDQSEMINRAVEVEVGGKPLFDTVQATWNLLEPSAGPALKAAADTGMAVIVKEPMANGRLAGRDPVVGFRLKAMAAEFGLDQVALAAALAQPWASVVLLGAATEAQLKSNLGARSSEAQAVGAVVAESGELVESAKQYWQNRSELAWN